MVQLTGLDDKVAIVTGAGRMRSIGRPIAVELARGGCDVVLTGTGRPAHLRPADEIEAGWLDIDSVAEEVRALGRRAHPVVSDVADSAAVDQLVQDVVKEFGRVDFLINNAGAARGEDRVPVVQLSDDLWDKVIQVNVYGTFYMSRAVARHLPGRRTRGLDRQHQQHRRQAGIGEHRGLQCVQGRGRCAHLLNEL